MMGSPRHYALLLRKPPQREIAGLNKQQKYHAYRRHVESVIDTLRKMLEERGMAGKVARWGTPTAFDVYTIDATEDVATILRSSPDVADLEEIAPTRVELLRKSARGRGPVKQLRHRASGAL